MLDRFPSKWIALAVFPAACTAASPGLPAPAVELPDGLELVVAAAPPLVNYPIMGCIDDRGRLFIGDAAGLNLDKQALEEQLPNRVLVLEDTNGDGIYDKSTVFADRMTFPSGGCWLDGSLYVASPPGIWKLTDTNGDSVADQREMIVGGFEGYTGNGSHIKGPFLHPTSGRIYWCNAGSSGGRTLRIVQKDGTLVREGRLTGVWSSNRDGTDIQWHSLGAFDNPVEVDFTAEGEIVGVVNVHNQQPRQDTLVHFLYGGVYERPIGPRSSLLADLPHTLDHMPIVHNFGHVAVSGFTRYRSGALNPAWRNNLFVTFFNTQKLVRVQLTAAGSSYSATEFEFLKLHDPNAHFTDVIEDADGSLLVLDTGGWFRRGCPASMSEKPDLRGAVYRIRPLNHRTIEDPYGLNINWAALKPGEASNLMNDSRWIVRERAADMLAGQAKQPAATARVLLDASKPYARLRACEAIAQSKRIAPGQRQALLKMLGEPLDAPLEHAAMFAAIATNAFDLADLREAVAPTLVRRLMVIIESTATDAATRDSMLRVAIAHFASQDAALAQTAVDIAARHPNSIELCHAELMSQLAEPRISQEMLHVIAKLASATLTKPPAQDLITTMLPHRSAAVRQTAWRILSGQSGSVSNPEWFSPIAASLDAAVDGANAADLQLLIDAIGKLRTNYFDPVLQRISEDRRRPQTIRLKALAALSRPDQPLNDETFARWLEISRSGTSPAARIDAARFLSRARLSKDQLRLIAPLLASAEPMELLQLLGISRRLDPELSRVWALSVAQSPVFVSLEESAIRSSFRSLTPEDYENILAPSVRAAAASIDSKKRQLDMLSANAAKGRAERGRKVYEASSCMACHKVGELGRAMGPDLSRIGQIRQPRDLLESIIFPSATIAHAYETHVIETADGQTHAGTIKSDAADVLTLLDLAGQDINIPQATIVGRSVMPTSLMPAGLEDAFTEQELLDMIAWLVSLK